MGRNVALAAGHAQNAATTTIASWRQASRRRGKAPLGAKHDDDDEKRLYPMRLTTEVGIWQLCSCSRVGAVAMLSYSFSKMMLLFRARTITLHQQCLCCSLSSFVRRSVVVLVACSNQDTISSLIRWRFICFAKRERKGSFQDLWRVTKARQA